VFRGHCSWIFPPGVLVHENLEVVEATLLLVPDDAVRHVDFHKLIMNDVIFLGRLAGVVIRMQVLRQLQVSAPDFFLAGLIVNPEHCVVIFIGPSLERPPV